MMPIIGATTNAELLLKPLDNWQDSQISTAVSLYTAQYMGTLCHRSTNQCVCAVDLISDEPNKVQ